MKLLFDQNISFRLIEKIAEFFPEARQVVHLGLTNATDLQIWNFAKENGYAIVTYDADFYELASIKGTHQKLFGYEQETVPPIHLPGYFLKEKML